ncbi:MAG: UbiA family prenyltransferase [archaeon]|nr:UbiA family prenyltransferase [archaeon]
MTVKQYLKLIRLNPLSYLPYPLAYIIGAGCNNFNSPILNPLLAIFFATACGYTLNFIADARSGVDAISRRKDVDLKKNPILTGTVTEKEARKIALVTGLFSVLFILMVQDVFIISCLSISGFFSVFCYNILYWKAKPFLDILCIPICGGALLFSAGLQKITIDFFLYGLFTTSGYLGTELWDIESDKKAGLRTTAVILGKERTKRVCLILLSVGLLSVFLRFVKG